MSALVVGRREDVVVEDVRHRRRQVAVVLRVRLGVALLAGDRTRARSRPSARTPPPAPARPAPRAPAAARRRPASRPPRRRRRGRAPSPRATGCCRSVAEVGPQVEVAVAALPARHRVPGLRVHLHVEREQVVAALEPVLDRLGEEEVRLLALAQQPSLHVGEGADDRVDRLAPRPRRAQLVEREHRGESMPVPSLRALLELRVGRKRELAFLPRLELRELLLGAHPHRALEPVAGPRATHQPPKRTNDRR